VHGLRKKIDVMNGFTVWGRLIIIKTRWLPVASRDIQVSAAVVYVALFALLALLACCEKVKDRQIRRRTCRLTA